jgi:hypothetical protein
MKAKGLLTALVVALPAVCAPGSARADVVTYTISGTVDAITDTSTNHFVPTSIHDNTSTFVGTFSFDNSAPGSVSGADGFYRGTALNLRATVTIDGQYTYTLTTPSASDEIDILGTSFEFFKRGPTVFTSFAPNPPFSHFEFLGQTQTAILRNALVSGGPNTSAGVSDQQTSGAPYYFIGASITTVQAIPEPPLPTLLAVGAGGLLVFGRRPWKASA